MPVVGASVASGVARAVEALLCPRELSATTMRVYADLTTTLALRLTDGELFALDLGRQRDEDDVIAHVFNQLQDWLLETGQLWAVPRPPCPGHSHARQLVRHSAEWLLACPDSNSAHPPVELGPLAPDMDHE
jgi:hypothetical protein